MRTGISSSLRRSAKALREVVELQRERALEAKLNPDSMIQHLESLAVKIESGEFEQALQLHHDFAVVPHARWMAMRARRAHRPSVYLQAGRRGGSVRSAAKAAAARSNGQGGGRPKINYASTIKSVVEMITSSAVGREASDPNREIAIKIALQLPRRPYLRIRKQLRALGVRLPRWEPNHGPMDSAENLERLRVTLPEGFFDEIRRMRFRKKKTSVPE